MTDAAHLRPARAAATRAPQPADYDTVVVVCGLVSIGIAAVYWAMRIGFDNPVAPVAKSVCLALFIYTFPIVASWTLRRLDQRQATALIAWWRTYPFLWLVGLALTGALGRLEHATGLNPFPVIGITGAMTFALVVARWLRGTSVWRSLALIAGCGAFAVWASGVVWGRIYKNPLFYENFILDGKVHHDSLQLAALGNMLRTYHISSNGIDGLNYVPYHWGTPWLFAQWSNLVGVDLLDFYQLAFPVTMIPFFFGGTLGFAVAMRSRRGGQTAGDDLRSDFRFWLVFLAGCIGIIPISALDAMGVWTSNLLISESYTVAVPCALLMFATAATFYDNVAGRAGAAPAVRGKRGIHEWAFVLVGVPVGIVALGYLKISLMVLAYVGAIYVFFRLRLYRNRMYAVSAIVTTVLFYATYTQVSLPAHREGFALFDFLWSYVRPAWWPFFVVVHLFWSWAYVLVRLRSEGIGTVTDLREAAAEHRILDVEIVALVALLGLGPGLITHIDGGSAFYFSDVQRWLALGLILSRLPAFITALTGESAPGLRPISRRFQSRLDNLTLRQLMIGFLAFPVVGSMLANSVVWPLAMIRANAGTRHALYPPALANRIPLGLHGLPMLRDRAALEAGLRQSPNFVVGDGLRRLSALPDDVRQRTALFIPQDQSAFWQSLARPGACTFQPLVAPALSSMAMIDGMPPYGCRLSRYYGLGSFEPRRRQQTQADRTPVVLCRRAAAAGMDRVLLITFPNSHRLDTAGIECPPRQ